MKTQYVKLKEAKQISNQVLTDTWNKFKSTLNLKDQKKIGVIPKIVWMDRGFDIAGESYLPFNVIVMNKNYLYSSSANEFIKDTVIHELAHNLAYKLYGVTGHQPQWKQIAKLLGDDGIKNHNYSTPTNKPGYDPTKERYRCPDCNRRFELNPTEFKKYVQEDYECPCGTLIKDLIKSN